MTKTVVERSFICKHVVWRNLQLRFKSSAEVTHTFSQCVLSPRMIFFRLIGTSNIPGTTLKLVDSERLLGLQQSHTVSSTPDPGHVRVVVDT